MATSAGRIEARRSQREDVVGDRVLVRGTKRASRLRTVPIVTPWQRILLDYATKHAQGEAGKLFAFDRGFYDALVEALREEKPALV